MLIFNVRSKNTILFVQDEFVKHALKRYYKNRIYHIAFINGLFFFSVNLSRAS